jgi:hypothetical protein
LVVSFHMRLLLLLLMLMLHMLMQSVMIVPILLLFIMSVLLILIMMLLLLMLLLLPLAMLLMLPPLMVLFIISHSLLPDAAHVIAVATVAVADAAVISCSSTLSHDLAFASQQDIGLHCVGTKCWIIVRRPSCFSLCSQHDNRPQYRLWIDRSARWPADVASRMHVHCQRAFRMRVAGRSSSVVVIAAIIS